ncbi:acetyltransferase, GNAT family [Synechococcus sp. PCC 7335]|uniref:GNAT family N-acetyltransferase n=1 Tax=Synechococcus sp. (strain ATCC 29403 / PCC 7335) TaxID=91464 RepID=UPI00017EB8EE|nr:GNAT family N-acetyltransferase [Synechococcus sp. PCC 7335]EDX83441.1 acetyltransferase, GNAT family [Synechococcus sp. PCC 7335]
MIFFETERLLFRRFEQCDLDELARISADVAVIRYVGNGRPLTREKTQTWIDKSRSNIAQFGYGTGAVIEKEKNALIGWAGIGRPADDNGLEEVIYGLDSPYWRLGLGSELLAGLVCWSRDTLRLNELRATVYPENAASITLLSRYGFELVDDCYKGDPNTHLYILSL